MKHEIKTIFGSYEIEVADRELKLTISRFFRGKKVSKYQLSDLENSYQHKESSLLKIGFLLLAFLFFFPITPLLLLSPFPKLFTILFALFGGLFVYYKIVNNQIVELKIKEQAIRIRFPIKERRKLFKFLNKKMKIAT